MNKLLESIQSIIKLSPEDADLIRALFKEKIYNKIILRSLFKR